MCIESACDLRFARENEDTLSKTLVRSVKGSSLPLEVRILIRMPHLSVV